MRIKKIVLLTLVCLATTSAFASERKQRKTADGDEQTMELEEVEIKAYRDHTILKKTAAKLPKKSAILNYLTNGQGQHTQVVECNGKAVQLSRYYGIFNTSGAHYCKLNNSNIEYLFNFGPELNACSLRLTASGDEVLDPDNLQLDYQDNGFKEKSFNSDRKYVFLMMNCIYLAGPLYSGNLKDYKYHLVDNNGTLYTYSFESSGRYPLKNQLYAKGTLVIDIETFTLKSMKVDYMGVHNIIGGPKGIEYSQSTTKDFLDSELLINDKGDIDYALTHLEWNKDIDQIFDAAYQIRPEPESSHCRVTECWKVENSKGWNFTPTQDYINAMKEHPEVLSDVALSFPEIYSTDMSGYSASGCKYLPEKMGSIDWALDVSKAEHELNEFRPIEKQYETMSGTPFKYFLYDN